jgi:hypothetical protein
MSVHPFRIAVLIFLVGASVANYFATKAYSDRIREPSDFSVSTAAPVDNPLLSTSNPLLSTSNPLAPTPDPWSVTTPVPGPDPNVSRLQSVTNDKAWMREAIIVTIAGVAWFLVAGKRANQ